MPGERKGSKKLWKHIGRSRRQLVERGVDFDVVVGRAIDRALLVQLFSLHGIRSDRVGRSTTFTADRLALHSRLAERSSSVHSSFLVRARLDGQLVGALYGFVDPVSVHYYQSGWDPAFERASLGSVLIGEAVELASERGAGRFDFLRGDEAYKLRFGAAPVEDVSALVPRGISGHLLTTRDRAAAAISARRARDAESQPRSRAPRVEAPERSENSPECSPEVTAATRCADAVASSRSLDTRSGSGRRPGRWWSKSATSS